MSLLIVLDNFGDGRTKAHHEFSLQSQVTNTGDVSLVSIGKHFVCGFTIRDC